MTREQIGTLIEQIAEWPAEAQAEFVDMVAEIGARHLGVYYLDSEERADIQEALAEIARGEIASEREIEAILQRYGA